MTVEGGGEDDKNVHSSSFLCLVQIAFKISTGMNVLAWNKNLSLTILNFQLILKQEIVF
jgi:hypothetical protein